MYKKILFGCVALLFAAATAFNIGLIQTKDAGDISLDAITIMAQAQGESGDGGGIDYSIGYKDDPQPCTVVEYVQNEYCFEIWIPHYGWKTVCEWTYSQKLEFPGIQNYCDYTGGPSGCSYHGCIRN